MTGKTKFSTDDLLRGFQNMAHFENEAGPTIDRERAKMKAVFAAGKGDKLDFNNSKWSKRDEIK